MSSPCKLVGCKERMFDCGRRSRPQKNYLTFVLAHMCFKKSKYMIRLHNRRKEEGKKNRNKNKKREETKPESLAREK